MLSVSPDAAATRAALHARRMLCARFFEREALPLAYASREMAQRFARGGRLYAFGRGEYAAAAARLCAEFAAPGRGALPAHDVSRLPPPAAGAPCRPVDIAIAFAPPQGDDAASEMLRIAKARGAMTIAWPGCDTSYAVTAPAADERTHRALFGLLGEAMHGAVRAFLQAGQGGKAHQTGDGFVDRVAVSIREHGRELSRPTRCIE